MKVHEFWAAVDNVANIRPDWRYGQTAFNVLCVHRPDLSDRVRGTFLDPFYSTSMKDGRMIAFAEFIGENW